MDLAELGISIDARPIKAASDALDKLTTSGANAAKSLSGLADVNAKVTKAEATATKAIDAEKIASEKLALTTEKVNTEKAKAALLTQKLATEAAATAAAVARLEAAQNKLNEAQKKVTETSKQASDAVGLTKMQVLTLQYTMNDVAASLASGGSPMTILLQQGGQVTQAWGGLINTLKAAASALFSIGGAAAAAAIAIAVYIANLYSAYKAQKEFNNAVILSGGYITGSFADMQNSAKQLGTVLNESIGTISERMMTFAQTGKFTTDQIKLLTTASSNFAKLSGKDFEDVAGTFAKAAEGPTKFAMGFDIMSAAQIKQIRMLEESGKKAEALQLALELVNKELGEGTKQATKIAQESSSGFFAVMEAALKRIQVAAANTWRTLTTPDKEGALQDAMKQLVHLKEINENRNKMMGAKAGTIDPNSNIGKEIDQQEKFIATLQKQAGIIPIVTAAQKKANAEKANAEALDRKRTEVDDLLAKRQTDWMTKQQQINAITERYKNLTAGLNPKEDADRIKALNALRDDEIDKIRKKADETTKAESQFKALMKSTDLLITKGEQELQTKKQLTEQQAKINELEHFAEANKNNLSKAEQAAIDKQIARLKVQDDALKLMKQFLVFARLMEKTEGDTAQAIEKGIAAREQANLQTNKTLADLNASIAIREAEMSMISGSADEIAALAVARGQEKIAAQESAVAAAQEIATRLKNDDEATSQQIANANARVYALQLELEGMNKLLPAKEKLIELDRVAGARREFLALGKTIGDSLAEGFGRGAAAMGKLFEATGRYAVQADKLADAQASINKMPEGAEKSAKQMALAEESAKNQIKLFGDMAGAAKGFFKVGSKGYEAMQTAEKTFRMFELAMSISNYSKQLAQILGLTAAKVAGNEQAAASAVAGAATETAANAAIGQSAAVAGVAGQATGDPYSAFPRMAAMAAIMAALGFAVAGVGGSGPSVSAQRQAEQGTGTVLGDSGAKSESAMKALDLISQASEHSVSLQTGMLAALQGIQKALSGAADIVARTGIGRGAGAAALAETGTTANKGLVTAGMLTNAIGLSLAGLDKLLLGGLISKLAGSLFSTKKSLKDQGIFGAAQTVGSVLDTGFAGKSYANIETTKKKFGIKTSKSSEEIFSALPNEVNQQFGLVISSFYNGISEAAKMFGEGGDNFNERVKSFVIDIGHISLEGLSGEDIQKQLNAVFSKMGDELAAAAFPQLTELQKTGEGMFETLARLAGEFDATNNMLKVFGATSEQAFGAVGLSSMKARSQLIELAGGLDEFGSKMAEYVKNFYSEEEQRAMKLSALGDAFKQQGVEMPTTNKGFRQLMDNLVQSGQLATSEGQRIFNFLLSVQGSFAELYPVLDLAKIAADDLEKKIKGLEEGFADAGNSLNKAMSAIQKSINAEKAVAKTVHDAKVASINDAKKLENDQYEAQKQVLQDKAKAEQDYYSDAITAANKNVTAANKAQAEIEKFFDSIKNAIEKISGSNDALKANSYDLAQKQLAAAASTAKLTGALPNMETFADVIATVSDIDANRFSTAAEMIFEQMTTIDKLQTLKGATGKKLSDAEKQVQYAEQTVLGLQAAKENASKLAQDAMTDLDEKHKENLAKLDDQLRIEQEFYDLTIGNLDKLVQQAQDQIDIANSNYVAVVSLTTAMTNFQGALASYITAQTALNVAKEQAGDTGTKSVIDNAVTQNKQSTAVDTTTALDTVAGELSGLRADLGSQNYAIANAMVNMNNTISQWDGEGMPTVRSE